MTFRTDIFLLRIEIKPPITHEADLRPFDAAFRAIKEALITEATEELELVNREISGNLRSVVVETKAQDKPPDTWTSTCLTTPRVVQVWFVKSRANVPENILNRVKTRLSGEKCVEDPVPGCASVACWTSEIRWNLIVWTVNLATRFSPIFQATAIRWTSE